jgi:hypothetical protein
LERGKIGKKLGRVEFWGAKFALRRFRKVGI